MSGSLPLMWVPGQLALDFDGPARAARAAEAIACGPRPGVAGRLDWLARLDPPPRSGGAYADWLASLPALPWRLALTAPGGGRRDEGPEPTPRCFATVLTVDVREDSRRELYTVGALLYRGACLGCDWEGEPTRSENLAAEHGCDHAWPGWRGLPVVERPPGQDTAADRRRRDRALARIAEAYEAVMAGWEASNAPIRTWRAPRATRHHCSGGRRDMGVERGVELTAAGRCVAPGRPAMAAEGPGL